MKIKLPIFALFVIFTSCKHHGNPHPTDLSKGLGLTYSYSTIDFEATYNALRSSIEANPAIRIMAEVDHSANASTAGLTLPTTRVLIFGNPTLGTPLMQRNQVTGLDLPQKILVFEENANQVILSFNNTAYLSGRHGLDGVPSLDKVKGALTKFIANAGGGDIVEARNNEASLGEGLITRVSHKSFEDTYNSLKTALEKNPNLRIFAEVDHTANAAGVGQELNPTRLIIFGNPKLGTPMMQNARTVALDLPQKMLVWEDAAKGVHITYNDPAFLAKRHGIQNNGKVLRAISEALDKLSEVAVKN
ncbi:MAG TPA: DUF302 domain-containing protein [Eudoraea sp.]|nr:DUF302 domain-containing protein [Eudoraea sp.]